MTLVTTHISGSRGVSLTADCEGAADRPPVVLLHGGGQTRHSWRGTMHRLVQAGYRTIAYDARGHGDSDWAPDGDYSLPALADDLRAVLATLDRPAALVGASMGGMASFYAAATGSPATALVMVDIALRPNPVGAQKIIRFMTANPEGFATLDEAVAAVAAYNPDRPRPSDSNGLRKNLRLREDGRLHWHWDPALIAGRPTPEPPDYSTALLAVADGVTIPTLLMRGAQSDVVDEAGMVQMKARVPQLEIVEVAGAGHMVAGDRNDAFADAILPFLARAHQVTA
ncbi:MAG: alpha/beta hydrolase [Sphingobium sp.]|uniref:alpha/beta fold hydrolase n=1 Tax=Sphingobium sp. TaxID=1912891 RepID=UPI0029A3CA51|nr:alpha/beta hydrolase [Sphingobium sp.]MDX3909576.1 alpha/beta hydrolase [Sphingobium sp.]